jgi:4-amino-4-deoxy-L-arabinose transferase-like glycosyltransferase
MRTPAWHDDRAMSHRTFIGALILIVLVAAMLRGFFPAADPPWNPTVGIVWHDEGAWVHNARNRAIFGAWSLDAWNPMYIAPVFTALEYVAFELLGPGVRQARLVPEVLGLCSVLLLGLGARRLAGPWAGLSAAALLATNYVYVMWNRAALMEGPMVAFMVASWYCSVRAQVDARWGWLAGVAALLAFFTKAAAAFFVAALALDAIAHIALAHRDRDPGAARAGWTTLGGLAAGGIVAIAAFVAPNWSEYRFYNWQMSVTRKPSYDLRAFMDRITWFSVQHDIFTRSWAIVFIGIVGAFGWLAQWRRRLSAGERLLVLWLGLGALELIVHDVGNERRFVFFIPAFAAISGIVLGGLRTLVPEEAARIPRRVALLALPAVAFAAYVVAGPLVRLAFIGTSEISLKVRVTAAVAAALTGLLYLTWPRIPAALARGRWSPAAGLAVALLISGGHLVEYVQWAVGRSYENYQASRALGRVLPPGTLVHGKLANGLALENAIRPVFVGRGFGNYEDRKRRDDVRYILTYVAPSFGYESQAHNPVISEVLESYPNYRILMTFDVSETSSGRDRAALIDKFGTTTLPRDRAHD